MEILVEDELPGIPRVRLGSQAEARASTSKLSLNPGMRFTGT